MIKITELNKYFNKNHSNQIHVIDNSTITFPDVGLVTILGESGSGKTTLLNVIGGLDNFDDGQIQIDDYTIKKYNAHLFDKIRNEKIGYIFQNYLLLNDRLVSYNLELMLNMYDLTKEEKEQRIDYVLKAVGMYKYKNKLVSELSGGQQQRIAIARALIKSPSVILADEPTGNLDEKNTIQIMNIIKKISEKILVIMVSHEKSIAKSYADTIITVNDGKVVSIVDNDKLALYKYNDDRNIYLKEYNYNVCNYTTVNDDCINIELYTNTSTNISFKLIVDNGKCYLKSDQEIVVIDSNSDIQVKDEHRKELDAKEEAILNDYHLEKLEYKKTPRLSHKEVWRLALTNIKRMKKKNLFLSLVLFVMSALTILAVQSILSAKQVDYRHLSFIDSRLYNVKMSSGTVGLTDKKLINSFGEVYDQILTDNPNIQILPVSSYQLASQLNFHVSGYTQLQANEYALTGYTLTSLDILDESKLIYGKMPKTGFEIVIDEWIALNLLENDALKNFMTVSAFVGQKLKLTNSLVEFTISGVARTNENSVYVNKWALFAAYPAGLNRNNIKIGSVSEYQKYDPNFTTSIKDNEVIISTLLPRESHEIAYKVGDILTPNRDDLKLEIVEIKHFVDDCGFNMIISDDAYDRMLKSIILYTHQELNVYVANKKEKQQFHEYMKQLENKLDSITSDKLQLEYGSKYDKQVKPAEEQAKELVKSRGIITVTILLVTVIIIFFTMKSFAVKNMYNIGVYRAIGISKFSINLVYIIQVFLTTLKTTLISCTLCYLITNVIAGFPTINTTFVISFITYVKITLILMIMNIIIGVLPIAFYMRLTPSKILHKYDI